MFIVTFMMAWLYLQCHSEADIFDFFVKSQEQSLDELWPVPLRMYFNNLGNP